MNRAIAPGDLPDLWDADQPPVPLTSTARRAFPVIGGLAAVLLVMAAVIPVGAAVIGQGRVGVETRVKRVAHPTGGVIAEIAVANGDHVASGQLLMRLDDRVTGANATYSSQNVEQLLAQQARLQAERVGAGAIAFPLQLTGAGTANAVRAMADERSLFVQRRREQVQLQAQLNARVLQYENGIAGLDVQIAALGRQLALLEPEIAGLRELWEKRLVTIGRLNQLERGKADLEGRIGAMRAEIAQTRARITETREQSIQLVESRRAQAGNDLNQITTALNEQQTRSIAAGDQQTRIEIRAPYAGTVEKIAFAAIGDVVKPAEPIMEIVPDLDEKVVEVAISPNDVDQVRIGQPARVRFTGFNLATTPELIGKVSYVASDRSDNPDNGQSFFVVRVAIDQPGLRRTGLALRSGMPAEVYVETGSRSLLSYLFKPIRDQVARALNDG
jgi:HlyD family type I secretion membrane fusion protein